VGSNAGLLKCSFQFIFCAFELEYYFSIKYFTQMKGKTVVLIGATGLVGSRVLELLQNDAEFSEIRVLVRKAVNFKHPKVTTAVVDFSDETSFKPQIGKCDLVFCAVGTTNKKVKGNKAAYRKVDFEIPVNAAKYALEEDCPQFVLVSSIGANSKSSTFYTRLKGETEDRLSEMNIPSLLIFRPSLLLGERNEFRFGEFAGKILMIPLAFLLPEKMKPISAENLAKAMVAASKLNPPGKHIYHYSEMKPFLNA
jgi:uncharacterized protein YbjT (DUF2867 family)